MKKALLFIFSLFLFYSQSEAQTFSYSDDFEGFEVGDYLGANSDAWTTWSGDTGTPEDVQITDEKASSGTKAIKFSSNASTGGPQDVVLYYGGQKLTSGFLSSKMKMLVETGAYFNYQAEVEIGVTWAMNANFDANGVGRITSSGNQPILEFNYPMNEWFEFETEINFDINKWELKVNGECVGSFESGDNSVASIDIFPTQGQSFFIDDFTYSYNAISPEIKEDIRSKLRSTIENGIAGNIISLEGSITNLGSTMVTSFEAEVINGAEVIPFSQDGLTLGKGETHDFVFTDEFIFPAGNTTLLMNVKSVNGGSFVDEDDCNDRASVTLFGVEPALHKKIVVEEATGTWCGFCPRGTVWMDRMNNRYPDHFIGIAVHGGRDYEPMRIPEYEAGLGATGYPNAVVNRGGFIDPSNIETPILEAVTEPSFAILEHGALWDEDSRELMISLDVTALTDINTNYSVNVVLTEDGVTGTGQHWGQSNYFSGSTDLIDDNGVNWKDLPSTVPAEDMVYDHVARAILAPYTGMEDSFEEMLSVDGKKTYNFAYTIPEEFDAENMHIIAFLINPNGRINTGESTTIDKAVANGFSMVTSTSTIELGNAVNVYPNPMNEFTTVDINLLERTNVQLEVVDLSGKLALQKTYENRNGFFRTNLDVSSLPVGTYVLKINTDNNSTARRITIVR